MARALPKRFQNLPAAPKGMKCMIVVLHFWGKGKTWAEAYEQVLKVGCHQSIKEKALAFHVSPEAWVDDFGSICRKTDVAAVKIAEISNRKCVLV